MGCTHSKPEQARYRDFLDITLHDPLQCGKTVVSQQLWQFSPALILLIRRPGCTLCREEALELTRFASKIQGELGIRMIAICHEGSGAEEFLQDYWPMGEMWLDSELRFYDAIAGGRARKVSRLAVLTDSTVRHRYKVSRKHVKGNRQGEGRVMGGLLIIGQGDSGLIYSHLETTFGDRMDASQVVSICEDAMKTAKEKAEDVQLPA